MLTGQVVDAATGAGIGGAYLDAWVEAGGFGYSYGWANGGAPGLHSDQSGRFRLPNLPNNTTVWLGVSQSGYVQQCAAETQIKTQDGELNALLTGSANVVTPSSAPALVGASHTASGTVYELTADGRRPLAGVNVDVEPAYDFLAASTTTDANGQYLLCGLPVDVGFTLNVYDSASQRSAYRTVNPGQTTGIDFELTRKP